MGPEFGQGAGSRTRQNSIALPVLSCPARIATSLTPPFVHSLVKNTLLSRHRDMVALRGNAPRSEQNLVLVIGIEPIINRLSADALSIRTH